MTATDLRAWRDRMDWTQTEAARQLHMDRSYYVTLESGVRTQSEPARRRLWLACVALEHQPETRV